MPAKRIRETCQQDGFRTVDVFGDVEKEERPSGKWRGVFWLWSCNKPGNACAAKYPVQYLSQIHSVLFLIA